jgi:hypothetical protein
MVSELALGDRVRLLGERDDVPLILRALDVFVLSSIGEGISNAILEAMATGLPVIATRVGGNVELVRDGLTGRVIEPRRPEARPKPSQPISTIRCLPGLTEPPGASAGDAGLERMLAGYTELYRHTALEARPRPRAPAPLHVLGSLPIGSGCSYRARHVAGQSAWGSSQSR